MSLPPESIEPGRCYLLEGDQQRWVRLVAHILPSGRVRLESRDAAHSKAFIWANGTADLTSFAEAALREVPCAWTPDADGANP